MCVYGCLQDERQPVDDVEGEEKDGERDEEELVDPPVLLCQLLDVESAGGRGRRLDLVLEVLSAHDLDVHPVLAGDVALLLEKDGGIPGRSKEGKKESQ